MTRRDGPAQFMDAAKATTGAALALAKARLLIVAFAPPCPSKGEVCESLTQLIEQLTPRNGQRPSLIYRPAPTPAKRNNGHDHAGATTEETT